MKRAVPVVALSIVGLIAVWRHEPSQGSTETTAGPDPAPSASASASTSASAGSTGSSSATVVKGSTVTTDKGPVQVQVAFEGGRITAVTMLRQPNHPQTRAAVPRLVAQTLKVQSADVDTVTGATITSDAYKESLQAAIDARGA
ncbi:FMN-binding domain-containing protein [Streptomyces populi]|uniref:FMN-binding domain-containing protein n=1 Tax=Streptomyces populi TaxID=2058924 RepID=A0A2I0SHC3_9ACTN|nr:FMN-binding protein [Streptomyces populi]PKT69334.1 FMN-binding domain-containing protein [Streptomyces populi]